MLTMVPSDIDVARPIKRLNENEKSDNEYQITLLEGIM